MKAKRRNLARFIYVSSINLLFIYLYLLSLYLSFIIKADSVSDHACLLSFRLLLNYYLYLFNILYSIYFYIIYGQSLLVVYKNYWKNTEYPKVLVAINPLHSKSEYQDRYRIWSNILYIVWEDTNISYYVAFTNRAFRPGAGVLTKDRQKIGTGNWIQLREWFWVTTGWFQSLWIDYESGCYLSPKKIFGDFKYCQSCTQRWVMQK